MKKLIKQTSVIAIFLSTTIASAQYTKLYDFEYANTAASAVPDENLIEVNGELYGTTYQGGINDQGTVFKIQKDGTGYTLLYSLGTSIGRYPKGSLYFDGTFLYGTAWQGGNNLRGTIFKLLPDGTSFSVIHNFDNTNGRTPEGSLVSDGTYLYGTASLGGPFNRGTIFRILPDGTGYQDILDFTNSSKPLGNLLIINDTIYGVTSQASLGGSGGEIFKVNIDGSGYSSLLTFSTGNFANGYNPYGSLIFDGEFLYGATSEGGTNSVGTLFKIKPDGTSFTTIFNFVNPFFGGNPFGEILLVGDFIYGMNSTGGAYGFGNLFKISKDGQSSNFLIGFDNVNSGNDARGGLIYDGSALYGMTRVGGLNNAGTIFKYCMLDMDISMSSSTLTVGTSGASYQWYDCNTAQPLVGETNQSFTPSVTGTYQVEVTINGCTDVSNCTPVCVIDNSVSQNGLDLSANQSGVSYQWIDCNNNNAPIAGETNQTFTVSTNGNYAVIVDNGNCSDTSICVSVNNVGLGEYYQSGFNIYPNPTNNTINIHSQTTIQQISIIDINGRVVLRKKVYSKTISNLDVSALNNGMYFIKVIDVKGGVNVSKIIKQ